MADLQEKLKYKKDDADDWTKVEDKGQRKKIQNRLAKRKARTKDGKSQSRKKKDPPDKSAKQFGQRNSQNPDHPPPGVQNEPAVAPDTLIASPTFESTDEELQSILVSCGLSEHRFICLTEYSVLRACVRNATILTLGPEHFLAEDSLSPWTLSNPCQAFAPQDLMPTPTQLCTPHHPYLDIIPLPAFRDHVLVAALGEDVEEQLCQDIHRESFTVWGSQPWNAMAWEVTQVFVTSWWWLLDDEMVRATNFWRGERGEAPLVIPEVGGGIFEELF